MKICKRVLAVLLCAILLIGILPLGVFAENNNKQDVKSETGFGSANALDIIANNLYTAGSNDDYIVSYVKMNGKKAIVDCSNAGPCLLVVAIYDQDSMKMLASGMTEIEVEHLSVEVDIDIASLPEYFIIKAYLLDKNYAALSEQYTSYEYTTKYEEFLEKKPEDYNSEDVIVFDDDKEIEDFAVLVDEAVSENKTSAMTFTYNEDTDTFVFTNATDKIKNLKPGDKLYYPYGDGSEEFILLKVKSISVSGNKVTIVEDMDIDLAEFFEFVRVDSSADYSNIKDSDIELGEGFTLKENLQTAGDPEFDYDDSMSRSISTELKYYLYSNGTENATGESNGDESISASIKCSFTLTWKQRVKLIYDAKLFAKDYYEFKSETTFEVNLADIVVTGTFKLPDKFSKIDIPVATVGPFTVKLSFQFVFEVSVSFELDVYKWTKKTVITADKDNGMRKTSTSEPEPGKKLDFDNKGISIKIGGKVTLKITLTGLSKKWQDRINASFSIELGVKFTGNPDSVNVWTDKHHDCTFCVYGDAKFYFTGTISLNLIIVKKVADFSVSAQLWNFEKLLFDWHLSLNSGKFSVGKGPCHNKSYKVTFVVYALENNNTVYIKDATVTSSVGFCDNDLDEKWDDHTTKTDSDGKAVFYFKPGEHTITAYKDGYPQVSTNFRIIENTKTVDVKLTKNGGTNPDPGDTSSDGTGNADNFSNIVTKGAKIKFGSYPQSLESTPATLLKLNASQKVWHSYNYYTGTGSDYNGQMTASNYMQYCDVKLDGNKYRGVTFSQYRPASIGSISSTSNSSDTLQDDNGFNIDTVYWFKYEPLEWRVLDASSGLVMCETIIDSQPYNNYLIYNSSISDSRYAYFGDSEQTYYASDYANSSIRKWLTENFYATAFSSTQQSKIKTATLNNDGYYTLTGATGLEALDSASTNDKIFLLSYDEVINSNYGFDSSNSTYDSARQAKGSDYAKCQGLRVYNSSGNSYDGCSDWYLRSPSEISDGTCGVAFVGGVSSVCSTHFSGFGVRPALQLNLSSLSTQSDIGTQAVSGTGIFDYSCSGCEAGGEYILLNVTGYGDNFTLKSSNLEFIDQITADASGKVSGKFMPRKNVSGSTTLLIGKFGDSISAKKLTVTEETTGTPDPVIPDINIKNYKSSLSADYKAKLIFHTDIEAPEGYKIVWSTGDEGSTCTINQATNSEYKIKADLVRISDSKVVKSTKEETVKVNTGFFARIIAFFRGLFGSLPVYEDNERK